MKKTRLIAGCCLIAQSILFFILFLRFWNKSKSLARTMAVFSAVGGIAGAYLVVKEIRNKKQMDEINEDFEEFDENFIEELEEAFDGDIDCAFGEK